MQTRTTFEKRSSLLLMSPVAQVFLVPPDPKKVQVPPPLHRQIGGWPGRPYKYPCCGDGENNVPNPIRWVATSSPFFRAPFGVVHYSMPPAFFVKPKVCREGGGSQPPVLCSAAAWVVSSWRPMTTLFLIAQRRGTEDLSSIPTLLVANPFQGRFIPEM